MGADDRKERDMPGTDSTHNEKKSWLVGGDENSIWFFVGATFAFAGAAFGFSAHGYLLGGLLMAVGALLLAVGIWVWQRGFRRTPQDHDQAGPGGGAP